RGAGHVSTAGLVMAFNPDDPHDGHAATGTGFTYRMIHLAPALLTGLLADLTGTPGGMPLFAAPVLTDSALAAALRRLHRSLTGADSPRTPLPGAPRAAALPARDPAPAADRIRAFLHDGGAADATLADVATAAGCSRFVVYRAFRSRYGLPHSDYQP